MVQTRLTMIGPPEMARTLAERTRVLRLLKGWTQRTLAQRAGVTTPSFRRFETTGKASLELILKVAHALSRLEDFDKVLVAPPARSIQELEERTGPSVRRRGRI